MKTSVAMFRKYRSSIHFTQRRQLKRKNPENKFISSCQNEFLMQSLISYEFLFLFYGVSFSQSSQEREGHFEGSLSNSSCSCSCTLQYLREYNWFVFFYRKSKKNMYTILKLEAVRILFKNPNQWYFMTQTWIIIYPIHFLSRTSMPFRHIKTLSSIQYDRSICNMSAITKKNLVQRWRWGELCPF